MKSNIKSALIGAIAVALIAYSFPIHSNAEIPVPNAVEQYKVLQVTLDDSAPKIQAALNAAAGDGWKVRAAGMAYVIMAK